MPLIGVILKPGNTGANVQELHSQLTTIGVVIAPGEMTAEKYGESTTAAIQTFRQRYGLPSGDTVDLPMARLMHTASVFAGSSDRVALRAAVREAASAADTSQPQVLYWLARYGTLAGDYQTALDIAEILPNHPEIRSVIHPILALPDRAVQADPRQPPSAPQPRAPEVPYPENFYTYRRPWVDPEAVKHVASDWPNLPPNDTTPSHKKAGPAAVAALQNWQDGNGHFIRRRYDAAVSAYDACQDSIIAYFETLYTLDVEIPAGDRATRLIALVKRLYNLRDKRVAFWSFFQRRRELLALAELEEHDSITPGDTYDSAINFAWHLMGDPAAPLQDPHKDFRERNLDAPLVTLAFVLIPLARAEANRARRQFDAALRDLHWVLNSILVARIFRADLGHFQNVFARLACEFIELPFAKLLLAETMLDKADAEYKARIAAEPPPAPEVAAFQHLKAAQTYLAIKDQFRNEGEYVARVDTSRDVLTQQVQQRLAADDTRSPAFQLLGKDILVPTLASFSTTLPGLDRRAKAHEPLLQFISPAGQSAMRETNPRVYSVLLTVTARLEQMRAGFNYLGYLDTYVPPWRFQFLLERARYFAEHAKNAQRDYLNFLNNAEREDFQELSVSQNVEMEKSNVRIETARVDQIQLEINAAAASKDFATIAAANAESRRLDYANLAEKLDELERDSSFWSTVAGVGIAVGGIAAAGVTGGASIAVAAAAITSMVGQAGVKDAELSMAQEQREFEKQNLVRAEVEARQAVRVADAQLAIAGAGLVVGGLQRQAALLRHEFALQNLNFLRNRVLSAEQWYRLVAGIRGVSETYLRYSVELAFLAEQAYEFEADKRINVIRFDYDLSEVGDFLAADFLLRDLDMLEQDLIITQRQRQLQVRYVLSMAREMPEALQEIRDAGKTTFSLRLEQLERRFPGLYNLRIGAVDVLPVALLDSTRFSLALTHLGTSQVRLKAQPDSPPGTPSSSPLDTNDLPVPVGGWMAELKQMWPVKFCVTGPETDIFSGLTRQDANAVFAFATAGQRHAFEALGASAAWQVDFTARENQMVPGSLADLLITFTVSGYHNSELRAAIDMATPEKTALTSFVSARQTFPDAFYDFSRTGRIVWKVRRQMLTLSGELGRLRNIGFSLRPGVSNMQFSRLMTRLRMNFRVNEDAGIASGVTVFTAIPEISVTQTAPLTVAVVARLNSATELVWDFGDSTPILRTVRSGTAPIPPAEGTHVYEKPGRYLIKLRCIKDGSLSEFRISIVVSRVQILGDPFIVSLPGVTFNTADKTITISAGGAVQQAGRLLWRVGDMIAEGDSATFSLRPGHHTLDFTAIRRLNFRGYGAQRYGPDSAPLPLMGLSATTNRTFDENGQETNNTGTPLLPARNELAQYFFDEGEISPEDDWTFELVPEEILGVPAGSTSGAEALDLSEIQDVVLSMEYDLTPGGP